LPPIAGTGCGVKVPLPPIDGGDGTSTPSAGRRAGAAVTEMTGVACSTGLTARGALRGAGFGWRECAFTRWDCVMKLSLNVLM
jgi:hypothetical protein